MLSQQELEYSQQKNREHIWTRCEADFKEVHGVFAKSWNDCDMDWISDRFEYLCKQCNITAW